MQTRCVYVIAPNPFHTHFRLGLSKHILVSHLKASESTQRDYNVIVIIMIFVSPPTAATSSPTTGAHTFTQAHTVTNPQTIKSMHKHTCSMAIHKLSQFFQQPRCTFPIKMRVDFWSVIFSGSPPTSIIVVCHPVKSCYILGGISINLNCKRPQWERGGNPRSVNKTNGAGCHARPQDQICHLSSHADCDWIRLLDRRCKDFIKPKSIYKMKVICWGITVVEPES